MGKVRFAGGGGNGFSSDDCTAVLAVDVVAGKTAITSDSDDEPGIGALPDKNDTTQQATPSLDTANSRLQMTIPVLGRYNANSRLYAPFATIRDLIGLTAAKIVSGNTILGLAGTATGDATLSDAKQLRKGVIAYGRNGVKYTGSMTEQGATTITPSKAAQSVAAGTYLAGKLTIDPIPSGVTMSFINAGGKNDHSTHSGRSTNYDTVYPNGNLWANGGSTPLKDLKTDGVSGLTLNETSYMYDWYYTDTNYFSKDQTVFLARPILCEMANSISFKFRFKGKRSNSSDNQSFQLRAKLLYWNDESTKIEAESGRITFWDLNEAGDQDFTRECKITLDSDLKGKYKWVALMVYLRTTVYSGSVSITMYQGTGIVDLWYTT